MSNKLYSENNSDYLVEGSKSKGYLKSSNKGYGDGTTSSPVNNFNSFYGDADGWFEGKKSNVSSTVKR